MVELRPTPTDWKALEAGANGALEKALIRHAAEREAKKREELKELKLQEMDRELREAKSALEAFKAQVSKQAELVESLEKQRAELEAAD